MPLRVREWVRNCKKLLHNALALCGCSDQLVGLFSGRAIAAERRFFQALIKALDIGIRLGDAQFLQPVDVLYRVDAAPDRRTGAVTDGGEIHGPAGTKISW